MEKTVETKLNDGQKKAVEELLDFLLSDQKEFNLSGAAGTGKTFMMRYIESHILDEYKTLCTVMGFGTPKNYQCQYVATTNKAAEVLSKSILKPTSTVHSFLGLRVKDNYSTGKQDIIRTNKFRVYSNILLFIDEASMIDENLYSHLMDAMDDTCKIIYVGDHFQLAPVSETISQIYNQNNPLTVLTEPMRNNTQPALMALCDQFRRTVDTGKFFPIKLVKGVIDWIDGTETKALIDSLFKEENSDARILCYTNDRVSEYNQYIRNIRNYGSFYAVGENLILNTPFEIGSSIASAETEILVTHVDHNISSYVTPEGKLDTYKITVAGMPVPNATINVPLDTVEAKKLLKRLAKKKLWTEYFGFQKQFPDLRPRDASTVHKAQGSTYETVIIDLDNIGRCFDRDQTARMLYVAISRARSRIYLRGILPDWYGGSPYYEKNSYSNRTS